MKRRQKKWGLVIYIGLLLVFATAALEIVLRTLGVHHPVLYVTDPAVGYRLQPNQRISFFGNEIVVNEWGVRDPRPLARKDPDTTRILVLGDSVTWGGVRVGDADLFTSVLERELGGVEVINAGVNGFSTYQMAALYREHLYALNPDLIVLYAIPGDFLRPPVVDLVKSSPAYALEPPPFALHAATTTARMMIAARLNWNWLRPPTPVRPRPSVPQTQYEIVNIESIIQVNRTLNEHQQLVVVISPYLDHPKNPDVPGPTLKTLSEGDIPVIELTDPVLIQPECFSDHIHLTIEGHKRVGEALASQLRPLLDSQ